MGNKIAIIKRYKPKDPDQGTPGYLTVSDGSLLLNSLELPFRADAPGVSCILAGAYTALWDYSPHLDRFCYHLVDAETRHVGIRVHSGNFAGDVARGWQSDVEGCILLGLSAGELLTTRLNPSKMQAAVLQSHVALDKFNAWGGRDAIRVIIDEVAV